MVLCFIGATQYNLIVSSCLYLISMHGALESTTEFRLYVRVTGLLGSVQLVGWQSSKNGASGVPTKRMCWMSYCQKLQAERPR